MKYIYLFIILLACKTTAKAQDNYDTDLISSALRNRANAVIRNEERIVDMRSPDNVMYSVKQAITVLNKNGEDNARLVLFYDKNVAIKSIKGEVYNDIGKQTHKFSQSDFKDESAVQGFSLFEDNRIKHFLPAVNNYPYTVVYTYEIRFKQNLNIPSWFPKPADDVAVERSLYTFICKPTDQLNIKTQNLAAAEEKTDDKQKMLIWQVNNLPAVKTQPYSPFAETYEAFVKIAPQHFSYYNYKGSYTNWQELGKWSYDNLLKNRDELPATTIATIKELVKNETSDKEKAKKIYQYLQNKTRYISIQVGIGGLQPFKAAEVDRLGYGDCKALVNYMQSLLNVVNIESYYCVVEAGSAKKSLDLSYASMNQGNHIILCLPLKGDTTWLECTNQKIAFGFLGDFTDDRYVLACTPDGGKLLKTPKYVSAVNLQTRKADLVIDKSGNVTGKLQTVFAGTQFDNHEEIVDKPFTEQQKLLKSYYNIDNITLDKINYQSIKNENPNLTENLELTLRHYGVINNDKFYLSPNAFNSLGSVPDIKNRTLPIYINRGFTDIDTVIYTLPDNVIALAQPIEKNFVNEFGSYQMYAKVEDKKLIYYRKLMLNDGTFPAENYSQLFKFVSDINTADNLKMIFSLKK